MHTTNHYIYNKVIINNNIIDTSFFKKNRHNISEDLAFIIFPVLYRDLNLVIDNNIYSV